MFYPVATMTALGTATGASSTKVVAVTKKTVVPAQKRCIPTIGVMAEASSTESQESSPHGQTHGQLKTRCQK
jgi:hypothetical protein